MPARVIQLLSGRDFARGDPVATEMRNFVYLVADADSRKCLVVDPAYDVDTILARVRDEGLTLSGAVATHYHPDHVGGNLFGHKLQGIRELVEKADLPVHVNRYEASWVAEVTGIPASQLIQHASGDELELGSIKVVLIHTPGHTPGSHCLLVDDRLITGDTLFLEGCGRVDLPGADPEAMYFSLNHVLSKLPEETVVFPGHFYSPASCATLGAIKQANFVFKVKSLEEWRALMGA
jgi:hydroxyacylglutathione hydrolase